MPKTRIIDKRRQSSRPGFACSTRKGKKKLRNTGYFISWTVQVEGASMIVHENPHGCLVAGKARHKYGEQRLWGTLGWGLSAVVSGALVDWYSAVRVLTLHQPTCRSYLLLYQSPFRGTDLKYLNSF